MIVGLPLKSAITDFNGLHDVLVELNNEQGPITDSRLLEVFLSLPSNIQMLAHEWSCSDTVFRDEAYVYLRNKGK